MDSAELRRLIETKQEEFSTLGEQLAQAQRLVTELSRERELTKGEITNARIDLRQVEREEAQRVRLAEAEQRRARILKEYTEKSKELDELTKDAPWRNFAFEHQIDGGRRLAIAERGLLADKRGLGKTLTSLIWCDMVQAKKIAVVAINDVVPQFEEEIKQWQPHRKIFSLRGLNKQAREIIYPMLTMVDDFIVTINFEAWRKDKTVIDQLTALGIDTVIIDEAHKIKNARSVTARGVFSLVLRPNYCSKCKEHNTLGPWFENFQTREQQCPCSGFVERTVKNVLALTGTPILNRPQELFPILHVIDPVAYDSEKHFLDDYCYQYATNRWQFKPGGLERLSEEMSEFFVQRTREQAGITIPPPSITVHELDKDREKYPRQYKAEKDLRERAALILDNDEAHSMLYILEIILRERQIMVWPAGVTLKDPEGNVIGNFNVEESQKLDAAGDLLSDLLDEEERVIVFSKFKAPLYELKRRFPDKTVIATGDQGVHVKEAVRRDFDLKTAPENPRWNACFATYDAFGTGMNLNGARHMIMLDDEWNPGSEDQAIGRIDRLNSVDQANVHIFRVKRSIDDFMANLIEEKRKITEGFESSFSAADLLEHLKDGS